MWIFGVSLFKERLRVLDSNVGSLNERDKWFLAERAAVEHISENLPIESFLKPVRNVVCD